MLEAFQLSWPERQDAQRDRESVIYATLKSVNGNKTEAAKVLGIAYSTLYEKMTRR